MDTSTLQSILNSTSTNGSTSLFDVKSILDPLMPYVIVLTIVSIIITILYLISIIQKIRVNSAILEIRKLVRELNERDAQRSVPQVSQEPQK